MIMLCCFCDWTDNCSPKGTADGTTCTNTCTIYMLASTLLVLPQDMIINGEMCVFISFCIKASGAIYCNDDVVDYVNELFHPENI